MAKHTDSIDRAILDRVLRRGPGSVFTAADFLDLGSSSAVHQALSRNARAGTIRKIARGVYDLPRVDPQLGAIPPSIESVAEALRDGRATRLQPSGAHAANLLGLSTQVPVHAVYLTDGRSRDVRIGKRRITLKQAVPRQMATAGRISGTVIQALRWIGRENVDEDTIDALRRRLSEAEKRQLLGDVTYAPRWIAAILRQVAEQGGETG